MIKNFAKILIYTLICIFVVVVSNYFMYIIRFGTALASNIIMQGIFILWFLLSFSEWFIFGNILKHNVLAEAQNRFKLLTYILLLISVGGIITSVNILGYASGYDPLIEKHVVFSNFNALSNYWYHPVKLVLFYIQYYIERENYTIEKYMILSNIGINFLIITGVLLGFNTKQVIKKSRRL
ncbi:MAG TPA: hypothetical protein VEB00_17025 [Clostridia bacterium]|nr:hypothetical protein [Clostridia bacterium]